MNRKKETFDINLPIAKNIADKTIGFDLQPFDPINPKHIKEWREFFNEISENLRKEFKDKKIPFPNIKIDSTPGPITYGIKTINENGKTIHSHLPKPPLPRKILEPGLFHNTIKFIKKLITWKT